MTGAQISLILSVGGGLAFLGAVAALVAGRRSPPRAASAPEALNSYRMQPLETLPPLRLSRLHRCWMIVLRGYLIVAVILVVVRVVQVATSSNGG